MWEVNAVFGTIQARFIIKKNRLKGRPSEIPDPKQETQMVEASQTEFSVEQQYTVKENEQSVEQG
jgi:hypothetical protein